MNKVFLQGNLTRDPTLRYTQGGAAVAEFGVAVDRRTTGEDGAPRQETCFVEVLVTDELAEQVHPRLRKGGQVFIEGRLRQERWETREGARRSKLKVVAGSIEILAEPSSPDGYELPDSEEPF